MKIMINEKEAKKLLRKLLKTYSIDSNITESICQEYNDLLIYIFNLPRFERHKGCLMRIQMVTGYGGRKYKGLVIVSANRGYPLPVTLKSLSAKKDYASVKTNKRIIVLQSMRDSIQYQIDEFRASQKIIRISNPGVTPICQITGKRLTSRSHVDHYPVPFIQIADSWVTHQGYLGYKDVTLKRNKLHPDVLTSWQNFHQEHCQLRLVSASANMKEGSRGYSSIYLN